MDVDLILNLKLSDYELAEKTLAGIDLRSRLPVRAQDVIKMRKEYIENRNLIAWSFVDYKDPTWRVDILITKDLKEMNVEKVSVGGRKICVVSLPDLLAMKSEAGRPQDLVDIESIKAKLYAKK